MLAGRGVSLVVSSTPARSERVAGLAVTGGLIFYFSWFLPQVRAVGDEAWAARADVEFAHRVMATLPKNSVVLTHTPSLFLVNGVNAAQMSLVTSDPNYVVSQFSSKYAGGVFLHWNAWCGYMDREQQAFCESTLKSFTSDLVTEYRERDFRYALYRLHTAGTVRKVGAP
jgi:hypothetical protein